VIPWKANPHISKNYRKFAASHGRLERKLVFSNPKHEELEMIIMRSTESFLAYYYLNE
jgi:hypothetical protein